MRCLRFLRLWGIQLITVDSVPDLSRIFTDAGVVYSYQT